jgi:Mg2+ and Co2+ transporter CorA
MKLIPIQIDEDGEIQMVMPETIIEDGDIMVTGDGVHLPVIHIRGDSVIERLDIIEDAVDRITDLFLKETDNIKGMTRTDRLEDDLREQTARITGLYDLMTEHKRWLEHISGVNKRLEQGYYHDKQDITIPD